MTTDGQTSRPLVPPAGERDFYTRLRAGHSDVVPVIGAGLASPAGAPGFWSLIEHLRAESSDEVDLSGVETDKPFEIVDAIATVMGENWIRTCTAAFYRDCTLTPTPALMALARASSGLIITTNYDLAIETAAEAIGVPHRSLTLEEFDAVLAPSAQGGQPGLRVLHLHGVCTRPETVVLTDASYAEMLLSEESRLLLRAFGATHTFVFLGHSLDVREAHIRRDLRWTYDATSTSREPHLFVTSVTSIDSNVALSVKKNLEDEARIRVIQFDDPDHHYQAAIRAAHAISGPSKVDEADHAPLLDLGGAETHYLPLHVAEASTLDGLDGPDRHGTYRAQTWQGGPILSTALDDTVAHMVFEGEGGAGKSQELLHIVMRSGRPSLHERLTSFAVGTAGADPAVRFIRCMANARAAKPGTARLTLERLREESYVFALDALDEVPAASRPAILSLLVDVATAYPQHRFVVGSRPLPELRDQAAFARWTAVTDITWVNDYALARGVEPAALAAALPDDGEIADLIQIPIYAAAAVGRVYLGEPLPPTALELVCSLTDELTGADSRIEATTQAVRTWLDRLALSMTIAGVTEVSLEELVAGNLHDGLLGVDPSETFLADLAARALLRDGDGAVRFPANIMKEARAARALLEAGEDGLDLLRRHALIELAAVDSSGTAVRAVHPAWNNVVELLLPLADTAWQAEISAHDPLLVARKVRSDASVEEREQAARLLWDTYVSRRVWLERRSTTGGSISDGDALHRLVSSGLSADFHQVLLDSLHASERTERGNAIDLLASVMDIDDLIAALTVAVRDPDTVVRRRAAAAGWTILARQPEAISSNPLLAPLADIVAEQSAIDTDTMAAETLVGVAVDLAPRDRAIEIALAATGKKRRHALGALSRREDVDRAQMLTLLGATDPFDLELLDEVLEERALGRREPWASADVASLAQIVAVPREDDYWHEDAMTALRDDPVAAVVAMSTVSMKPDPDAIDDSDRFPRSPYYGPRWRLIPGMTREQLTTAVEILAQTDPATRDASLEAAGLGHAVGQALVPHTVDLTLSLLNERQERLFAPVEASVEISLEDPDSPGQSGVSVARRGVQTHRERHAQLVREAEEAPDSELVAVFEAGGVANAFDAATGSASMATCALLDEAAKRDLTLSTDQCAQLFTFLLNWSSRDLDEWLHRHWTIDAYDIVEPRLADLLPAQVLRLAELLPGPWGAEVADRVLDALATATDRLGYQMTVARTVAANAGEQFLRDRISSRADLSGAPWTDAVLVHLGDAEAEARMITSLAAKPETIRRHPNAYDEEWVSAVSAPSSGPLLADLIKKALVVGVENAELEPLFRALDRTAGLGALAVWESLSNDPDIPSASFLFYERRVCLATLLDEHADRPAVSDSNMCAAVVSLLPLP